MVDCRDLRGRVRCHFRRPLEKMIDTGRARRRTTVVNPSIPLFVQTAHLPVPAGSSGRSAAAPLKRRAFLRGSPFRAAARANAAKSSGSWCVGPLFIQLKNPAMCSCCFEVVQTANVEPVFAQRIDRRWAKFVDTACINSGMSIGTLFAYEIKRIR